MVLAAFQPQLFVVVRAEPLALPESQISTVDRFAAASVLGGVGCP